jgi:hypothetical protein
MEGERGAEHRQPEKQDAREFIAPNERLVKKITRADAREQHDDFSDNQQCGERRDQPAEGAGDLLGPAGAL